MIGAMDRSQQQRRQRLVCIEFKHTLGGMLAAAVIFGLSLHPAFGSSIALREGSTDWMANAFAGEISQGVRCQHCI